MNGPLKLTGQADELAGITLELGLEVPARTDPPVRRVLLWAREGTQWRLTSVLQARPGSVQRIHGLRPDTDHRVCLDRGHGREAEEVVITFHTPVGSSRLMVTVVVHCTGFEAAALVDPLES
ncbi:hypothetical protein OG196_01245 [Kitasatospora purpeofusca]|uniref:hypothetical protein n=1 Tax=Kitasatospora purpeofusca TaxID=67352 RepID=UPI002E0DEB07|nr:hypothetical protein OG715_00710 [Kitasatospora purpeofusca]WSR37822.1 hypothetical protein OG196_01245 [Kitasatospora purpeofusca]